MLRVFVLIPCVREGHLVLQMRTAAFTWLPKSQVAMLEIHDNVLDYLKRTQAGLPASINACKADKTMYHAKSSSICYRQAADLAAHVDHAVPTSDLVQACHMTLEMLPAGTD